MPGLALHLFGAPRILTEDEGRHRAHRVEHRLDVRAGAGFAPPDESVVGLEPHDAGGHAVALHLGADLTVLVGDVGRA